GGSAGGDRRAAAAAGASAAVEWGNAAEVAQGAGGAGLQGAGGVGGTNRRAGEAADGAASKGEGQRFGVRTAASPAARDGTERIVAVLAGVLRLARVPEPQADRWAGGVDADAVPERDGASGAGALQGGGPMDALARDRDRLGMGALPAGERGEPTGSRAVRSPRAPA